MTLPWIHNPLELEPSLSNSWTLLGASAESGGPSSCGLTTPVSTLLLATATQTSKTKGTRRSISKFTALRRWTSWSARHPIESKRATTHYPDPQHSSSSFWKTPSLAPVLLPASSPSLFHSHTASNTVHPSIASFVNPSALTRVNPMGHHLVCTVKIIDVRTFVPSKRDRSRMCLAVVQLREGM